MYDSTAAPNNNIHTRFTPRAAVNLHTITIINVVKVKPLHDLPLQQQRGGGGRRICNLGFTTEWVVSTMSRPLYPREIPGTHCTGNWVGFGAVLDGHRKTRPHQNSVPGQPR